MIRLFGEYKDSKIIGAGMSRTISISNTKKITASKKNRREKGIRALALGSNPHSKGEDFSRSSDDRNEINKAMDNTKVGIKREILRVIREISMS